MPRLVHDWKRAHRWFSVQVPALSVAILLTWQAVPDDLRAAAPSWLQVSVLVILILAGIAGRLVEQPNVTRGPDSGRSPS